MLEFKIFGGKTALECGVCRQATQGKQNVRWNVPEQCRCCGNCLTVLLAVCVTTGIHAVLLVASIFWNFTSRNFTRCIRVSSIDSRDCPGMPRAYQASVFWQCTWNIMKFISSCPLMACRLIRLNSCDAPWCNIPPSFRLSKQASESNVSCWQNQPTAVTLTRLLTVQSCVAGLVSKWP